MRNPRTDLKLQTGAALLTVLFMLAILATFAAYTLEDENLAIRRLSNQREYEQSLQVAIGGELLALKELERDAIVNYDSLDEPWATTDFAGTVEDGGFVTTVEDESGKFNLNNLKRPKNISPTPTTASTTPPPPCVLNNTNPSPASPACNPWYEMFYQLLQQQGFPSDFSLELADAVVDWVDTDNKPTGKKGFEDDYYQGYGQPYRTANRAMVSIAELSLIAGFNTLPSPLLEGLTKLLTALPVDSNSPPTATKINVNTAPIEVLKALYSTPPSNTSVWATIAQGRISTPYQNASNLNQFHNLLQNAGAVSTINPTQLLDTKSGYFKTRSCAHYGRISTTLDSQMKRTPKNGRNEVLIWGRQRVYQTCGKPKDKDEQEATDEEG